MSFNLLTNDSNPLYLHHEIKLSWMFIPSFVIHLFFLSALFMVVPPSFTPPRGFQSVEVSLVSQMFPETIREEGLRETRSKGTPSPQKTTDKATEKKTKDIQVQERTPPSPITTLPKTDSIINPNIPQSNIVDTIPSLPPPVQKEVSQTAGVTMPAEPVSPPVAVSPLLPQEEKGQGVTGSINAVSLGGGTEGGKDGTVPMNAVLFKFPYYLNGIENKISLQWSPPPLPPQAAKKKRTVTVIRFIVKRNGRIDVKSVAVEKSSGNPFFDASALRAIYNANPLPPLPRGITEDLRVHFEFEMRLPS